MLAGSQVLPDLQHAVLQHQHLRQRVVEERRAEGHVGGRGPGLAEPHLELARRLARFLDGLFGRGCGRGSGERSLVSIGWLGNGWGGRFGKGRDWLTFRAR